MAAVYFTTKPCNSTLNMFIKNVQKSLKASNLACTMLVVQGQISQKSGFACFEMLTTFKVSTFVVYLNRIVQRYTS